jgi:hypothetical protein
MSRRRPLAKISGGFVKVAILKFAKLHKKWPYFLIKPGKLHKLARLIK